MNPRQIKGKLNISFSIIIQQIFNQGIENLLSTFIPKIFMLHGHMDDQNNEIGSESKGNNDWV
jgi:hypothetical protein